MIKLHLLQLVIIIISALGIGYAVKVYSLNWIRKNRFRADKARLEASENECDRLIIHLIVESKQSIKDLHP